MRTKVAQNGLDFPFKANQQIKILGVFGFRYRGKMNMHLALKLAPQ